LSRPIRQATFGRKHSSGSAERVPPHQALARCVIGKGVLPDYNMRLTKGVFLVGRYLPGGANNDQQKKESTILPVS
jgi:hypothetical protein